MSALFINGSPNKNGNTAKLASRVLKGKEYETLNLTDYKLYSYGQDFKDDQFEEIYEKMKKMRKKLQKSCKERLICRNLFMNMEQKFISERERRKNILEKLFRPTGKMSCLRTAAVQ